MPANIIAIAGMARSYTCAINAMRNIFTKMS
jgi:hypothetical protein